MHPLYTVQQVLVQPGKERQVIRKRSLRCSHGVTHCNFDLSESMSMSMYESKSKALLQSITYTICALPLDSNSTSLQYNSIDIGLFFLN